MKIICTLILLLTTSICCYGLDSLDISLVDLYPVGWDDVGRITISGDYAFLASRRTGAQIIDIENPENLQSISSIYSPYCMDIAVLDTIVCIADSLSGIIIVDISEPECPDVISRVATNGEAQGVIIDYPFIFVADGTEGICIIDITDIQNPYIYSSLDTDGNSRAIARYYSTIIVADGEGGLCAINATEPEHLLEIDVIDLDANNAVDVDVEGGLAVVAADSGGTRIVDISNPSNMVELGTDIYPGENTRYVDAIPGHVWATYRQQRIFRKIDTSDPYNPVPIGLCELDRLRNNNVRASAYPADIFIRDNIIFLGCGWLGLATFEIPVNQSSDYTGVISSPNRLHRITASEDYIAAVDRRYYRDWMLFARKNENDINQNFHLTSMDITDIVLVDNYLFVLHAPDEYAYGNQNSNSSQVIDIENPSNPILHDNFSDGSRLIVQGTNLFLIYDLWTGNNWYSYDAGLIQIDISNPDLIQQLEEFELPGHASAYNLCASENYVCVSGYYSDDTTEPQVSEPRICLFEIEENGIAARRGYVVVPTIVDAIQVKDEALYTGMQNNDHLFVYDISNPDSSALVDSLGQGSGIIEMDSYEDYLYILLANGRIVIYDISSPFEPVETAYHSSYSRPNDISVVDGWIYTAENAFIGIYEGPDALGIKPSVKVQPLKYSLSQVYPNPFNSTTQVHFSLAQISRIKISVYDILGREVVQLVNHQLSAGDHSVQFDGSKLPSGIYFIHASVSGKMDEVRKVVLLR
ncbi:MAG: T9SS type A sorting domain-containing protein [Candidatus Electryonea clarkiae]|nr:T9SS type A sorting domain-containing protein [Candidatus Electryonea clarkiae]MDP8287800.1 T9SS type A sorting domain-containing protein [Candidatus Electryonea clarkiae]